MEGYPYSLIRAEMGTAWGNGGGPVFNEDGEVIGIVSRGDPNVVGIINFEFPSSRVQKSIENMRRNASLEGVMTGYWGFDFWPLRPEKRRHFDQTLNHGVWISHVDPDSPAKKAGLRPGDLLLTINGRSEVTQIDREIDSHRLTSVIYDSQRGERFVLTVLREGAIETVQLEADQILEKRLQVFHTPYPFAVREISHDERITRQLKVEGVTVILDDPREPLFRTLHSGSIVTHIDGTPTPTVQEFRTVLAKAHRLARKKEQRMIRLDFYRPASVFGREDYGFTLLPTQ
ncbi:MAG: PDZ domain-containing protein [Deltaproteobacteria bacterium]|nr:PDZ domain-containing protein [Deltaproteobacteria bacterium]